MRVPICACDLQEGQGFARLTNAVQREWPVAEPLLLADSQHALSRGLGYIDFNDLQQPVQPAFAFEPLTGQAEARDSISTVLFVYWKGSNAEKMDEGADRHGEGVFKCDLGLRYDAAQARSHPRCVMNLIPDD